MTTAPPPSSPVSPADLGRCLAECAEYAAELGWDGDDILFALVRTADLAAALPAQGDGGALTAVAQDLDDPSLPLTQRLGTLAWPPTVAGCAIVTQITVAPPADADDPQPPRTARLVAGVVRGGPKLALLALRPLPGEDPAIEHDLRMHPELATDLLGALAATLD